MADQFQYVKLPDGSYGKFRADATDDDIQGQIAKDFPDAVGRNMRPSVPSPIPPKGTLPAPARSGLTSGENEGPFSQALTAMETKLANVPSSMAQALRTFPIDPVRAMQQDKTPFSAKLKKINPIDTSEGSTAMNIGGTAANLLPFAVDLGGEGIAESPVGTLSKSVAKPLKKFALAPSDPDALYQSYLKPIANAPVPTPKAPAPVMRSILRDMEAAGEGDAAGRIQAGKATVGDLDQMRQRANRFAKSIYRSPGNYSPGMAEGADQLANDIRSQTYPLIESSQDLPEGAIGKIKTLQGKVMEAQRTPTFTNQIIRKAGGGAGGALAGYSLGGPAGGFLGLAAGEKLAGPLADAADRAITGLRTKALASSLPPPGLVRRLSLPPSRMMPPSSIEPEAGTPSFTEFTNPLTTEQLKNFILPEKSGAPTILNGDPQMTPGEKVALQDFELRKKRVLQLPEKGSPILLSDGRQ